jgi:putative redox protein
MTTTPQEGWVVVDGDAGGFAQQITAGPHRLVADEPASAGGTETGATPYDLLLAALGTCTSMTVAMYARRKQWPLQHVSVRLRHSRAHAQDCATCESTEARVSLIEREIELQGTLDADQRARLLDIANKCPVHRTLTAVTTITTTLV